MAVSLQPFEEVIISCTLNVPAVEYAFEGFEAEEVVASPNVQAWVTLPIELETKERLSFIHPLLTVNPALGLGKTDTDLVVESLQPLVDVAANFTLKFPAVL